MERLELRGAWEMTGDDGRRFQAAVPGTVLGTLLEHGEISDPFDGMNEEEACAQTRRTWTFRRTFTVTAEQRGRARADLVFEGLDTLAEIRVNGRTAARTDNMHRTWRIPVKDLLREGENRLEVTFFSAMDYVEKAAEENPEVTDRGGSGLLWTGSLRKAHYMFGWDWGPRLPDAGIWRPARVEFYDSRIGEVRIHQEHRPGEAAVTVDVRTGAAHVRAELLDPDGRRAAGASGNAGESLRLAVAEPRLWWPNGLGDQPLYTLRIWAETGDRTEDERELRLGLRTLGVSRRKDEWGESFALCCNGVDFFAMGADYIPEDNLLGRTGREKTERLLRDCRDSHFNTVRVWGGGIYPDDDFYDLCDGLGLVVWQDLMFACNTYKMTDAFRENITREAEDNLRRIRHHACLGLVCGNNEMETAWENWDSVRHQAESLKRDYTEQFEKVLKEVCGREAPDVFYWPSSPSSGGGFDDPNGQDRGDVHDWAVWHGREPASKYTERYPRFCSEFGFESFPCMRTLESFIHAKRDMNPFSRVMERHQKCWQGNVTMLHYLSETLRYPFSMEKLAHATQWMQAEAIRTGVEHWRRNRGRCMGAVYWQMNDCWPTASWSGIDSAGRWKALQYAARRFFAPVAVSLRKEAEGFSAWVVNERREAFRGRIRLILRDARGIRLAESLAETECPPLGAARAGGIRVPENGEPAVAEAVLEDENGAEAGRSTEITTLPRYFPFEEPGITVRRGGRRITLTARAFCMGVEVQAGEARFSDNWFCLFPGEEKEITADRDIGDKEIRVLWIE